ncbi:MAG: TilS substrate-binding domain-containing protein, partial [Pyrinomonadaceae bacterium]
KNNFETSSEISLKKMKELTEFVRNDLVRQWLKNQRGNLRSLDAKHFEAIERLIFSRKSGRKVELPNGETVTKSGGKILFEKRKVEK